MTQLEKSKIEEISEEINQCRVEASFNLRFLAIEMNHYIGKLVVDSFGDDLPSVLPTLSKKCNWSERSFYRAVELYKKHPVLAEIPFGKAVSMNRLLNDGKPEKVHCANCKIPNHCPK